MLAFASRHSYFKGMKKDSEQITITFRQIDAFRAIMLKGSLTAAAEQLGISQPAISRLLADLENELHFDLFKRIGRRIHYTEEALSLFEEVSRSFAGLDRIKEKAKSIRSFRHAKLAFVAIPSVSSTIGVDLVDKFSSVHKEAAISLEVQPTNTAVEWILSQQADIALAHPYFENPSLESKTLHVGRSICLLPDTHQCANKKIIKPEHLINDSYISFQPDSDYRQRVDDMFQAAGVERNLQFEGRTTEAVYSMVSAGLGVAVVGQYLPRVLPPNIVVKPLEPDLPVELAAIWYRHRPLSAVASEFLDQMIDYFAPENLNLTKGFPALNDEE